MYNTEDHSHTLDTNATFSLKRDLFKKRKWENIFYC